MSDEAHALAVAVRPLHRRIGGGLRRPGNWLQLLRFGVVGASGYAMNLVVFAAAVSAAGVDHRSGATLAFLVAVANNFVWNRRWTFASSERATAFQAPRFLAVSLGAFLVSLLVLEVLVSAAAVPELAAQAIAVVTATPLNFLGNRLWSFRS